MKRKMTILLALVMVFVLAFGMSACSKTEEAVEEDIDITEETAEEPLEDVIDGAAYGYVGSDPVEAAVYQYVVEEFAPMYELPEGAVSIPVVQIIDRKDLGNGDVEVYGNFWIDNYTVNGDTLECVSGGNHPGKITLTEAGSGYGGKSFDAVGDGGQFEPTAKEIFGDLYDKFMKVYGDSDTREALRAETIANYVRANGLDVTKYQDYGWDPVDIPLDAAQ